ncbi:Planctomycete cytochrome C [Rubripirellula tenax]|uniref:Planctomycete cytochrome C n=1 Tax=Rubripirellula tenax TaxID=2528015 RepID=A0A5C6FIU2_9BACT|nr:DUF1553 domain-containing protein [Rubripirellula tenax]TWU59979.1 Planctomycete cytochrome C [Rubripirellula tenax]
MRFTRLLACLAILFPIAVADADDINFNRDIRPILSDKCFFCHGPDEADQESGLRLDSRDAAIDVIESGDLMERVASDDPDVLMPPPESNLALTDADREMLKRWIEAGAPYQGHWAFEPLPQSVAIPTVNDGDPNRHPIDRFVLAKLAESKLKPAPPADPLRWLRRVTLDLTGLPPTPTEITAFEAGIADLGDTMYAQTVDSLLQSPAFGEQMAVAWLDAARYADSYGYQSDKLNTQWPYRDWVVKALNDNLPYDDFLTWQLAGDLLENPTREQILATAFNRIHRLNNEGGAVFEEWRIENAADRVHTFGTAVLGLTMECCRCHDHKYDPIPMRDYYSLSSFFNSIDESGVYDRTEKVPCPSLLLPTPEQQTALDDTKRALTAAEESYRDEIDAAKTRFDAWKPTMPETIAIPDLRLALSFDRPYDNSIKEIYHPSESDRSWTAMPAQVEVNDIDVARLDPSSAADKGDATDTLPRRALKLDGERGITTKDIEPFDRWMSLSVVVTFRETKRVAARSLIAHHTRGTDCGYNGWDLTIEDGHLESRMARVWPGNAIAVRTVDPIPVDRWHQVAATYDGSSSAAGMSLYLNGKRLETEIVRDELKKSCNVLVDHGGQFVVGQRFRARGLDGGLIDDVRVYFRSLTHPELAQLATGIPGSVGFDYFVSAIDDEARGAMARLTDARKSFVMAEEEMIEVPIMREMDEPRETHVLARGEYNAPTSEKTRVERYALSAVPVEFPDDAPKNRLGLARWVTDPNHPLTSRVAVNRLWGNFFASPLVRTPENFGSQGDLPTHPELLDWLSRDFVDNGWDVKRLCKQIVLSSTYRQDSRADAATIAVDPTNALLARGPAYRLAAEQIRDVALSASGLLDSEPGGPPVSPYQPGGDLWKESNSMSPPYQQSVGRSLYRRSLYSVWKRTAPLPNMMAFDSTTREVCSVKRFRTNTPLQALVLLNDVQFVEAARVLAEQLMSIDDSDDRIENAFLRLAGRRPDGQEREVLRRLLNEEEAFYSKNAEAAKQMLTIGEKPSQSDVDPTQLAAMTNLCQAIMNLDATVWKR